MDAQVALNTAVILLALAAVGGVLMAIIRLRGAPRPPSIIAMVHGLAAGAALTLILFTWWQVGVPGLVKAATGLFVVAALGGVYLNVQFHSKLQPLPIPVVFLHAAMAVTGFVLLVLGTFGGSAPA